MTSDVTRVDVYKKIASIRTGEDREDLIEELIDRFGDPSRPVINLIDIAQLKALCQSVGIDWVGGRTGELTMRFSPWPPPIWINWWRRCTPIRARYACGRARKTP